MAMYITLWLLYHNEIIPLKKWAHNYITLTQWLISAIKLAFILRVNLDLMPWSDSRVEECANTVVISQGILPTCKFRLVLNMYIMLAESYKSTIKQYYHVYWYTQNLPILSSKIGISSHPYPWYFSDIWLIVVSPFLMQLLQHINKEYSCFKIYRNLSSCSNMV